MSTKPAAWSQARCALSVGDAPFSAGERELLAAYVSALNSCDYCQCEHAALATAFGLPAGLLAQLRQDVDTAEVFRA
jgi:AhpD family alkylhydroperoxidase